VYCVVDEKNTESQKLFERQGFVLCGRRKDWIKTPEGFIDELEYQKIYEPLTEIKYALPSQKEDNVQGIGQKDQTTSF